MAGKLCPTRSHFAGLVAHVDHSLSKEGGTRVQMRKEPGDLPIVSYVGETLGIFMSQLHFDSKGRLEGCGGGGTIAH